jgi:hypothetical protein
MSEVSRKVSILLNMELDEKVTKDEAEEIANRLEAVPREELWAALLEDAGVDANVISVDAEVVEVEELDEVDDERLEDDPDDEDANAPNDEE